MKLFRFLLVAIFIILTINSCSNTPKVVQGSVISYDKTSKIVIIKNELPPDQEMTFLLENAFEKNEVGADPAPYDITRIAYKDEGGKLVAIRVMNLTQQKELQKAER